MQGNFRKFFVVVIVAGLIGFVAGNAFWYLASPLWIDVEVSEAVSAAQIEATLASGTFTDVDRLHRGQGSATIFQGADGGRLLRLADEFQVTNGPDLWVWLVKHPNPENAADVRGAEYVDLGRLKGNVGDQNYEIPADADLAGVGAVVVWCKQFSVVFSTAVLAP